MSAAEPAGNARSRRTREALLRAMRELMVEQGFEALTMAGVAERAGVTRRALYLHFQSRAELVGALFDYIAEDERYSESVGRVWAAPDAEAALRQWADHLARYHSRVLPVSRALERVGTQDADAARHRARVTRAQLANCRRLARWLADDGVLAEPWTVDAAADMLWALVSDDLIGDLYDGRRWSQQRISRHLALLFARTFVRDA